MNRIVIYADTDGNLHGDALFRGKHAWSDVCPGCNGDLSRTALVVLAYVFTACTCGDPDYPHLFEQMWHTDCLRSGK